MKIYGIPLEDLCIAAARVKDPHLDRRTRVKDPIAEGTVFLGQRFGTHPVIVSWKCTGLSISAYLNEDDPKRFAFENKVLSILRPLTVEDLKDLRVRTRILRLALDRVGAPADSFAAALVVWEQAGAIDLEYLIKSLDQKLDEDDGISTTSAFLDYGLALAALKVTP